MTYVAFLRGVNVGGKGVVSMSAINSGNVIEQHTGMAIKVLVMDHKTLKKMVDAIPRNWVDDKTMRTCPVAVEGARRSWDSRPPPDQDRRR
jgi:uncharacterized protein (DUF1697 family)